MVHQKYWMIFGCIGLAACVHSSMPVVSPVITNEMGWSKDAGSYLYFQPIVGDAQLTIYMHVEIPTTKVPPAISFNISTRTRGQVIFDPAKVVLRVGDSASNPSSGPCDGAYRTFGPRAPLNAPLELTQLPNADSRSACIRLTWPNQFLSNWETAALTLDGLSIDGKPVPILKMGFRNEVRHFTYVGGA
jgi:hypothetical protein